LVATLALNILNCIWSYTETEPACKQLYSFRFLFVTSVLFYIACFFMPFVVCCSYIQFRLGNIKKAKIKAAKMTQNKEREQQTNEKEERMNE
jgi:hypothetical protein